MEGGADADYVTCPGKSYSIPVSICRSRQSWGFTGCRRCKHRSRKRRSRDRRKAVTR